MNNEHEEYFNIKITVISVWNTEETGDIHFHFFHFSDQMPYDFSEMMKLSLTEQMDLGIFNTSCIATLWCSIKQVFYQTDHSDKDLESGLTRQFWFLMLADLTEMDGEELLLAVNFQRQCDPKHVSANCPITSIWNNWRYI